MFQTSSAVHEEQYKTILLWTPWFANGWLSGYDHASWSISDLGFSWEDQKHQDLRDFGCDEHSYKCVITSNRLGKKSFF